MTELYYTTPSDEVFNEVKEEVLKLFEIIDGMGSDYYKEKEEIITRIENVKDNMMYLISTLSENNLPKLAEALSKKAKTEVYNRLKSVDAYEEKFFK